MVLLISLGTGKFWKNAIVSESPTGLVYLPPDNLRSLDYFHAIFASPKRRSSLDRETYTVQFITLTSVELNGSCRGDSASSRSEHPFQGTKTF